MSTEYSRLWWRCRRGTRELDFLLSGFLQAEYESLSPEQVGSFKALLAVQDPVIMDWLMGVVLPPPELRPMVEKILRHSETLSPSAVD